MAQINPLCRRMIDDMTIRNLSPSTQEAYVSAVRRLSKFFNRSPDKLTVEDIRKYQVHLARRGLAWGSLNQTVCALRFFYGTTLARRHIPKMIPYAREPRRLPVVLSADEVVKFLEAVPRLDARIALTTAYAAMSCCRITFWPFCDRTGGLHVPGTGCFPALIPRSICQLTP